MPDFVTSNPAPMASSSCFSLSPPPRGPRLGVQRDLRLPATCCSRPGVTYLVGAGPAGVDDLTHRAARLLRAADVVVTDALTDPSVLALASPSARVVHAGKRGGDARSVPQPEITALLVDLATAEEKRVVVRLKAGDPTLFGRAGDEISALRAVGCEVVVVPGVSSVSAAAAAVGESLTDVMRARSVVTVSGHDVEAVDYVLCAKADTVVFMMAGRNFAEVMRRFAEADGGKKCDRVVSVVRWAGRGEGVQKVVRAGIQDITAKVERDLPGGISPAVVLVQRK